VDFKDKGVRCELDSGYDPVTGFCEHGYEPSGSIEGGELLKKSSTVVS
jgi:hypothetical protein